MKTRISLIAALVLPLSLSAEEFQLEWNGEIRTSFNQVEREQANGTIDGLNFRDNGSKFNLLGEYRENDIRTFFHLQSGADIDPGRPAGGPAIINRFYYAGFEFAAGDIRYGKMSNAYKLPGFRIDEFWDTPAGDGPGTNGSASYASNYGLSRLTNAWTDNSLLWNGHLGDALKYTLATYLDDSEANSHAYSAGFDYQTGNLLTSLQYASLGNSGVMAGSRAEDKNAVRLALAWKNDITHIGLSHEIIHKDNRANITLTANNSAFTIDAQSNGNFEQEQHTYLLISEAITPKSRLAATLANVTGGPDAGRGWTLGLFHQWLKPVEIYALISAVNYSDTLRIRSVHNLQVGDRHVLAVGTNIHFGQ